MSTADKDGRPLAVVCWVDSCGSNDWCALEQVRRKPTEIQSVGWLLEKSQEAICIASTIGVDPPQVGQYMTIPTGCVRSIQLLESSDSVPTTQPIA